MGQVEPVGDAGTRRGWRGLGLKKAVLVLSALNIGLVALLTIPDRSEWTRFPGLSVVIFAGAFIAVGSLQFRLDFSQHRAIFTLTEAVLVVALFNLPPLWIGVAAGLGEAIRCLLRRVSPLKVGFNAISQAATATAAASAFRLLHGIHAHRVGLWVAALAAVSCWSTLNAVSVSLIVGRAEKRGFERTLGSFIPTAASTTILATALGLLVEDVWTQGPAYLLLIVPVALGVWLNGRHAAAQRSEHLRVERLYEATARTARTASKRDVAAVIAEEARGLLTGLAAVCLTSDERSGWSGRVLAGDGVADADEELVEVLLGHSLRPGRSTETTALPPALSQLAPGADMAVLARSPEGAESDLLVAVLRKTGTKKEAERGLGDTLATYVAHGAVIDANASLLSELHRSLEAQMLANQRKDEFVATISHELRTPLTVVLGSVETLQRLEGRVGPADRERLLRTAADQGQRLRLLIEDLLLVAAAEQGKLHCDRVPVAVSQLVEDLWADLPGAVRSWVHVRQPVPEVSVLSDRFKLRQIVTNLVQNAAKYAPGSVIEIGFERQNERLCVSVIDHGPGIPKSERGRVFERFVQLDQTSTRSTGGTGLGLFICSKLAEQMGATLELTETPGGGCTFALGLVRSGSPTGSIAVSTAESTAESFSLQMAEGTGGAGRQGLLARPDVHQLSGAKS